MQTSALIRVDGLAPTHERTLALPRLTYYRSLVTGLRNYCAELIPTKRSFRSVRLYVVGLSVLAALLIIRLVYRRGIPTPGRSLLKYVVSLFKKFPFRSSSQGCSDAESIDGPTPPSSMGRNSDTTAVSQGNVVTVSKRPELGGGNSLFASQVRKSALECGFTNEEAESLAANPPPMIRILEAVPPSHQARLLQLELESAKQNAEQKAKDLRARKEKVANDPFLTMIHDIAVEQGYSKGALAVLMSDLPESMLDVKALPVKHHRLALDAEVKEAREEAESKAAITN